MKRKRKELKKFFERNIVSKGAGWLSGILVLFSFIGLIVCSYFLNDFAITVSQNPENNNFELFRIISVFKDILVVIFSTFGVNLLISFCIEKKTRTKRLKNSSQKK